MSASLSTAPGTTLAHVASLQTLRSQLLGQLITSGNPEYDQARQVQDFTVDAHPLAIVRAATAQDVAAAIRYASHHDYPLAIRSGGHSIAGHSMIDDAVVIDMSGLKNISINPVTRVARVQAGVTSGDLAGAANELGLALTTGDTSSVGFGGLATGGGIGFMVRKYGLTIDSLISAQVVTAAGDVVTARESEHPDLFWAIRGGGGNFGVITEFTFRLAPVGQILGGDLLLPATPEVIRGYLEYTASAPEDLSTLANLMHVPPQEFMPFVPVEWVGKVVLAVIACWSGDIEEGERALAPLRALATPVADTIRPMPYPDIYLSTMHQTMRHGFALRSMFADELSDETINTFLESMQRATSPFSIIQLRGLGGQMARVSNDATAFAHRDKRYLVGVIGVWLDPEEDGSPHRAWTQSIWDEIRHEGSGVYVNFVADEGEERLRDAYPPETLARLADIKQTYDPENLFRFNQNIRPRS